MDVYEPPRQPDELRLTAASNGEVQTYKPPEIPTEKSNIRTDADPELRRSSSHEVSTYDDDEADTYIRPEHREYGRDSGSGIYEPPKLPASDAEADTAVEDLRGQTPPPGSRTATIKPRNGDRVSVYVPPPSPPALESLQNGNDEDETDQRGTSRRGSEDPEYCSGTSTVVIEQENDVSPEPAPDSRNGRDPGDQISVRPKSGKTTDDRISLNFRRHFSAKIRKFL